MKLSVIIPVYNERILLPQVLERINNLNLNNIAQEIVIVDDGSTDGTTKWLKDNLVGCANTKISYHQQNYGKGRAIQTGLKLASGDVIVIQDADLEIDPREFPQLLKPILDGRTKVVYGRRRLRIYSLYSLFYYLGNISLSFLTSLLYQARIMDMETCYKMFKREVMRNIDIKSNGFDFEPEITAKILKRGFRIHQIPISYNPRTRGEGKKIMWQDGFKAVLTLLKYRFVD